MNLAMHIQEGAMMMTHTAVPASRITNVWWSEATEAGIRSCIGEMQEAGWTGDPALVLRRADGTMIGLTRPNMVVAAVVTGTTVECLVMDARSSPAVAELLGRCTCAAEVAAVLDSSDGEAYKLAVRAAHPCGAPPQAA